MIGWAPFSIQRIKDRKTSLFLFHVFCGRGVRWQRQVQIQTQVPGVSDGEHLTEHPGEEDFDKNSAFAEHSDKEHFGRNSAFAEHSDKERSGRNAAFVDHSDKKRSGRNSAFAERPDRGHSDRNSASAECFDKEHSGMVHFAEHLDMDFAAQESGTRALSFFSSFCGGGR